MAAQQRNAAADGVRKRITSGELAPGDQVGASLTEMAREYGVGRNTMRDALRDLAGEGLVRTIHGKGTYVLVTAAEASDLANGMPAWARKLQDGYNAMQEDVADLKADVAELQSRRGIERTARTQEHGNEQSG